MKEEIINQLKYVLPLKKWHIDKLNEILYVDEDKKVISLKTVFNARFNSDYLFKKINTHMCMCKMPLINAIERIAERKGYEFDYFNIEGYE
jgi:hypothetical protein